MKNIIGIDLGGTNLRAGLISGSRIKKIVTTPLGKNKSEPEVLEMIYISIDKIFNNDVVGIGAGVPSVVDTKKGIVYDVVNIPSWKKVPLKKLLEKRYGLPADINNDANCFVMGEKYFGRGKSFKNIVGLTIGTGLGAGIIIENKLYEGSNCGAAEFGMIPYKIGILENYCSGQFFTKFYNVPGGELHKKSTEKRTKDIFSEFGRNIAEAIKIILYTYDPEIIILGGSASKSFSLFKNSMLKGLNTFAYQQTVKKLRIEVSSMRYPGILGAAALISERAK